MKKAFLLATILFVSIISTACINNFAVQELNNKAKGYLDSGDYENAISRLKSSLDLDSTIFETHYNLGIAYTQAEKYPEAVETFANAIKLRPDFVDTYYSLGVAQENYAKGIIDGTIKEKLNNDNSEEEATEPDLGKKDEQAKKELTKEQKQRVANLFQNAIESYESYLKKGTEIKDRGEVQGKIEYLQKQVDKYLEESLKS